jgi:hypothetical protein
MPAWETFVTFLDDAFFSMAYDISSYIIIILKQRTKDFSYSTEEEISNN